MLNTAESTSAYILKNSPHSCKDRLTTPLLNNIGNNSPNLKSPLLNNNNSDRSNHTSLDRPHLFKYLGLKKLYCSISQYRYNLLPLYFISLNSNSTINRYFIIFYLYS